MTTVGTGPRRRARECALQILYALEVATRDTDGRAALASSPAPSELEVGQALARYWRDLAEAPDRDDPEVAEYAERLVHRTAENLVELDGLVQRASRNWRLERMARVDRNILRLASCELRYELEVPTRVIINEAIEIAKRFGAQETPAFVNGLLDRISHDVRGAEET